MEPPYFGAVFLCSLGSQFAASIDEVLPDLPFNELKLLSTKSISELHLTRYGNFVIVGGLHFLSQAHELVQG